MCTCASVTKQYNLVPVFELLKESILGHAGRHVVSVKFCRGGVDHREDCSRRLLVHAKFHSMSARLGVYGTPKVVNVAKFENINAPESLARFLGKQISTFVCSSRASPCSKLGGIHVRDWKLWVCFPHTFSASSGETIRLIRESPKKIDASIIMASTAGSDFTVLHTAGVWCMYDVFFVFFHHAFERLTHLTAWISERFWYFWQGSTVHTRLTLFLSAIRWRHCRMLKL